MQDDHSLNFNTRIPLEELKSSVEAIRNEMAKVIVGQDDFVTLLIIGLLSDGHVLIEGVPGIAKTITSKLFAKSIDTEFNRIQFTPDLMPSDVLGTSILKADQSDFEFKKGPIFSNLVLIDEINRAPAKTQAALFEVMEEQQITMDGKEYKMPPPFMVIATQNPIEQEGTYELPEAQLDRFLFKLKINYPNLEEEVQILKLQHQRKSGLALDQIETVMNVETLLKFRDQIHDIVVEDKIFNYIAEIVSQTRTHPHLLLGGSPRASLSILKVAKTFAAIQGRDFVTPEDVKASLKPTLNHRIILSPEKEMEGDTPEQIIELIQSSVEIPR
jgi:MoxR-like ATPase